MKKQIFLLLTLETAIIIAIGFSLLFCACGQSQNNLEIKKRLNDQFEPFLKEYIEKYSKIYKYQTCPRNALQIK